MSSCYISPLYIGNCKWRLGSARFIRSEGSSLCCSLSLHKMCTSKFKESRSSKRDFHSACKNASNPVNARHFRANAGNRGWKISCSSAYLMPRHLVENVNQSFVSLFQLLEGISHPTMRRVFRVSDV